MSENIWKDFSENSFETNDDSSGGFLCIICNDLMSKPCSAPCGCRFCSDCIEHYLTGNDKFCPGTTSYCQNKMLNLENDIIADNSANPVSEIFVNCPRKNSQFTDEFGMIGFNLRPYENQNPNHKFGCEFNATTNEKTREHSNENNCCHSKLFTDIIKDLRSEIESMKNEVTEFNKQLYNVKLQSIFQQQKICELETKEETNASEIEELNQELIEVKNYNNFLRRKLERDEFGIETSGTSSPLQSSSNPWQQEDNKEFPAQGTEYETYSGLNLNFAAGLDKQDKTSKQTIDKKSNVSLGKMMETERKTKNLKSFCDFKWQIQNLSQWRGIQIFSKPFYSDKPGYKMCLSVYIDLNAIDVHFHLMCGKFDESMIWPFQYPVTIDVINQENGTIFKSKTRKFSGRNNIDERKKPSNERNEGICFIIVPINSPAVKSNKIIINCKVNR